MTDTGKTPPPRFKEIEDFTPAEHMEHRRSGAVPETPEFIAYRGQVLADAGINDDSQPKALEDMSPAEHLDRIQKGQ